MIKLTKKEAVQYKQRWHEIASVQKKELRTMPMSLKFRQLCFLMNSFHATRRDPKNEKEINTIRSRWLKLKKHSR